MNERIRELAKQAAINWQHQEDVIYSTMTLEQFEKFAELIVQECAEVADNADAMRQKWEGIGKYVKQHFGVE